jgi:hypothetical protein
MRISELNLRTITIIQLSIATIVSLLFQFIIPYEWQPLNRKVPHGTPGENIVFFTVSQWFFSFSVSWLIYRNNKYINSFIIFSFITVSMMIFDEFIRLGLFYDWYHLFPFSVDIYLLWKKRDTIDQRIFLYYIIHISIWLYLGYFLKLAYYTISFEEFVIRYCILIGLEIPFSFAFRKKRKD